MTLITIMEWKFSFTQNDEKKKQSMDGFEEDKTYAIIPAQLRTKTFTLWVSHFKFPMKMMKSSLAIGFRTLILTFESMWMRFNLDQTSMIFVESHH